MAKKDGLTDRGLHLPIDESTHKLTDHGGSVPCVKSKETSFPNCTVREVNSIKSDLGCASISNSSISDLGNGLQRLFTKLQNVTDLVDKIPETKVEDDKKQEIFQQEVRLKTEIKAIKQELTKYVDGLEGKLQRKCHKHNIESVDSRNKSVLGVQSPAAKLRATITVPRSYDFPFLTGGLFLLGDRIMLADNSNRHLLVYSGEGKLEKKIQLPGQPWDITFTDDTKTRAAVTLPNDQAVQFVDLKSLSPENFFKLQGKCYGISRMGDKFVVACVAEVAIIDLNGVHLRTMSVRGDGAYFSAHYVCALDQDRILYTDWCNHVLHCVKLDGTDVFQYHNKDMKCPKGIMVDNEGCVYVVGSLTHNVHQVDASGHFVKVVLSKYDGISNARAIEFSQDRNMMFVAHGNNMAKIYDLTWT